MVTIDAGQFWDVLYGEIGKPYVYGDEGPNSFDCSGLVQFVFGHFGVHTPRTAHEQQAWCKPIGPDTATVGDLVFWGQPAYHVGIVTVHRKILNKSYQMMVDAPDRGQNVREQPIINPTNYGRVPGVTWSGGFGEGSTSTKDLPLGKVGDALHAVVGWSDALVKFIGALLNPNTWLRIGEVALGMMLIAVGTAKLTNAVPVATKVAKTLK
jgi:cell wall-associated NlpC family hydrolase